jgi:hypothetical protein
MTNADAFLGDDIQGEISRGDMLEIIAIHFRE